MLDLLFTKINFFVVWVWKTPPGGACALTEVFFIFCTDSAMKPCSWPKNESAGMWDWITGSIRDYGSAILVL